MEIIDAAKTIPRPVEINRQDATFGDGRIAHVPTEELISPKVELQASRAMSVFRALQEIKKEHGEEVFDRKTARHIRDIEELEKIEDKLPPSIAQSEPDDNVKAIKFDKAKWYQRIALSFRNKLWIPRIIIELFKIPKKFDLKNTLKEAMAHLGLSDSEAPRAIVADDERDFREDSISGGEYHMHEDRLTVITDGFRFLRGAAKDKYHPSIKYWFDMLPKTLKDGLTNVFRESSAIKLYLCHELTHKRQALDAQKLTLGEAKETIENYFEKVDIRLKRFVLAMIIAVQNLESGNNNNEKAEAVFSGKIPDDEVSKEFIDEIFKFLPAFQEERTTQITEEERSKCATILLFKVNAIINHYLFPRGTSSNMKRYVCDPLEIEARMETDAFMLEESLQKLEEIKDTATSKNRYNLPLALKYLKGFLVDRVINGVLLRTGKMKMMQAPAHEIEMEETKIKALVKLAHVTSINATSTTEYLETEERLRQREEAKKKS